MSDLTKREQATLDVIIKLIGEKAYPPSVREIASEMGWSSTGTAQGYLDTLENKGFISREESKPRTLKVVRYA